MRLTRIFVRDFKPLKLVEIDGLSNVVVIAGPNGVGKTRLVTGLLNHVQHLNFDQNFHIELEATTAEESAGWGKEKVTTTDPAYLSAIRTILQRNRHDQILPAAF